MNTYIVKWILKQKIWKFLEFSKTYANHHNDGS